MGKFIAQERKNKRLTQEQLAEKIKVDRTVVSRWERGVSAPDISLLKDLAAALDVSVVELLNCKKEEIICNNDDVMIGAIKFYKSKTKKKMMILLSIVVIILLTIFITSSVVSKRNYFTVEEISYEGEFITSGYYFSNKNGKSIIFIKDLDYSGDDIGTTEEPTTNQIEVNLMGNENLILKGTLYCDYEYCSISSLLEDYTLTAELKNNYNLEDFFISIYYIDDNLEEHYYSIPLSNRK